MHRRELARDDHQELRGEMIAGENCKRESSQSGINSASRRIEGIFDLFFATFFFLF